MVILIPNIFVALLAQSGIIRLARPLHQMKKCSSITVTWSLIPYNGETADWLSAFYQKDSQDTIKEIWRDTSGLTHFGQQKFNQSLKVTYKKNQEFSVILRNVEESMNLYLTLVFMDTKGEI